MKHVYVFLLLLTSLCSFATDAADIAQLNALLAEKEQIDAAKETRIDSLRALIGTGDAYALYSALFDEYASYHYDSAYAYVKRLEQVAATSGENDKMVRAQLNKGFCYMSAGLFKESADIFQGIDITGVSEEVRRDYYSLYARLLYAMADYTHDMPEHHASRVPTASSLSNTYLQRGLGMSDSALQLIAPTDTNRYCYQQAVRAMKRGDYTIALEMFFAQLEASTISEHEKAITYSSMAYVYSLLGDEQHMQHYNILAAIADIRNSTKEAVALQYVARRLYEEGEMALAATYVRAALDDAQFYNARHRQVEISQILPIIERAQMDIVASQNRRIGVLTWFLVGGCILLLVALVLLYNHVRALRRAKQAINDMNQRLLESNHVKEEYIGTFLKWQTELLEKEEEYQRYVKKRIKERRYDELLQTPYRLDAGKQRQNFFKQFDSMFLHLFPHFVDDVNSLLRPDSQFVLAEGELLNTELRIFALIRLGITDNEKIAQVLDYSVNTIYAYKTRVHNRTNLTPEAFREQILTIA